MRDKLIKGDPTFEELAVATQTMGNPMISTPDFSQKDVKQVINDYARKLLMQRLLHLSKQPRKLVRALNSS
jgi:hypothetical protein